MDNPLLQKIFFTKLRLGHEITITVTGFSMNPTMWEGDRVTVRRAESYSIGDVLVFLYKGELLIHRLLKIENSKYFCKGDNAFRLEDIEIENIAGKVVLLNEKPLPPMPDTIITLSYLVNRTFRKHAYNIEKTKQSGIYRFFHQTIWNPEGKILKYQKNKKLNYITSNKTSLAVVDPETGGTRLFNESEIDILNALTPPCDIETLLCRLVEIYNVPSENIREEVLTFLVDCVSKKIIEVL